MIEVQDLTVRFGRLTAVNALSLDLPEGEIFGFIGPNGAGKTTTMKVLAGLLRPTSGSAKVDGLDAAKGGREIRRRVGFMPDFLGVYNDLTVDEYLQFFASAFGVDRAQRRAHIDQVLELTDLTMKRNAMVDSLSRGMQQRLGVARVLVHDPKVLLLDEPASGLDPRARIELRELIRELGKMGKTIIISSHILSELHDMCSRIGIIERGKLLYAGTTDDAFAHIGGGERIEIQLAAKLDSADHLFPDDDRIIKVETEGERLVIEIAGQNPPHDFILERLSANQLQVVRFVPQSRRLEDVFLRITQGAVQ